MNSEGSVMGRLRGLREPIRIGIVGAGAMGRGLCYQASITPGMECVLVADLALDRAVGCGDLVGRDVRQVGSAAAGCDAIDAGALAVCEDGMLAAACDRVDVIVEASSAVYEGARYCLAALERGAPVVLMNAEIDLAFGPLLAQVAVANATVCTSTDGDQHGVIKRLVDELALWGFELVMAGNIKGFLDRDANPASIVPEADKRHLDYRMCTAYTDGTKLCVEMALVANALGLRTDVPGMHGPPAGHVSECLELFDLERLRCGPAPVVDYLLGAEPGGGVYAIGYCDHPYQRDMMQYYKMGPGPFYLFYRPYHLCHVEAMRTIAESVLEAQALLQPWAGRVTDVTAYAKRDLREGEILDGIGGYCCYGLIENRGDQVSPGLPICVCEGARLRRGVRRGQRIGTSDVDLHDAEPAVALYRQSLAEGTGGL